MSGTDPNSDQRASDEIGRRLTDAVEKGLVIVVEL